MASTSLNDFVVKVTDTTSLDEFHTSVNGVISSVISEFRLKTKAFELSEYDTLITTTMSLVTVIFLLLIFAMTFLDVKKDRKRQKSLLSAATTTTSTTASTDNILLKK